MAIGLLLGGWCCPSSNGVSFDGKALSLPGEFKLQESNEGLTPVEPYLLWITEKV